MLIKFTMGIIYKSAEWGCPYRPQYNGCVERANRTVDSYLMSLICIESVQFSGFTVERVTRRER